MKEALLRMYVALQTLMVSEEGQDLVEYALIIALVSVLAVASLNTLSGAVNSVFSGISTTLKP